MTAQKQASQYARSLLEASLDPLVTISPEGKITDVNEATIKVTGVSREKLVGTDFSDYFTEPEKAREGYRRVFAKGFVTDYPLTVRHEDGRLTDVLYNASVYKDTKGNVLGVFAAARDITERKRAEDQLRKASAYARSLLEASIDPLVTISPEGKITDVNEAAIRARGASREALVGSRFSDYFTEPEKAEAGYKLVLSEGEVRDYPLTLRHVSGRTLDVLYNATVYRDDSGTVQGVFAAARDITDRKRAEESIQKLLRAVEQAENAIFMTEPDGVITFVNPAFEKTYGYSKEEAFGKTPRILKSGRYSQAFYERFWQKLLAGESVRQEFVNKRRDGQLVTVDQSVSPVLDASGKRIGFIAVQNDITERKRAEDAIRRLNAELEERVQHRTAELAAANEELESFAYAVSHDLRAPLRAMAGFSQALVEDHRELLNGEALVYLDQITIASRKMGELIDGILQLSRVTRGQLHRDAVDLSALARRILEELARAEPSRSVSWQIQPGLTAEGDARMLEVVLSNLLGNAWKYTGGGSAPAIRVYSDRDDGAQLFCVSDNGAGFDMAHVGKLFQPFQRLHRQEEFPGLGIGLATVQRIVHRHGGKIHATGAVGRGATFRFSLSPSAPESKEVS